MKNLETPGKTGRVGRYAFFYQFTVITDQAAGHDQVTGQVTELCGDYSVLAGFAYANDAYFTKSVSE